MLINLKSLISERSMLAWRIGQVIFWLFGAAIVHCLIFYPTVGICLFWDVLIPVAPAFFVIAIGIWRNVCPMGVTSLFPRRMNLSKKKKLTIKQTGQLNLVSLIALLLIVPLRHAIFNLNGPATAVLLISLMIVAVMVGFSYDWKSAWCSGLCPIHPVEKLYGINNRIIIPNAHCSECFRCVTPCSDSVTKAHPLISKKTPYHKVAGFLMVAGFPGFIWGWFHVHDYSEIVSISQLVSIYTMPFIGAIITSTLFFVLKYFFKENTLVSIFSASAVSCYYWYRLPSLFGFGIYPGDGMLIDMSKMLPQWSITVCIVASTLFFFWWIVFRKQNRISWLIRPVFSDKRESSNRNI